MDVVLVWAVFGGNLTLGWILHGKHLLHFAGYAKHVGLYPAPSGLEAFKDDLSPYKSGKGSVSSLSVNRCRET